MRKSIYIYLAVLLLLLAGATAWRQRPAEAEGSELYQRYRDVEGVRVGFVEDFPVSDSTSCDVTTFEALTDEGWEWLLDEFRLHEMVAEWERMDSIAVATVGHKPDPAYSLNLWVSAPNHPRLKSYSPVTDLTFATSSLKTSRSSLSPRATQRVVRPFSSTKAFRGFCTPRVR